MREKTKWEGEKRRDQKVHIVKSVCQVALTVNKTEEESK